jgi:hypothetical protein
MECESMGEWGDTPPTFDRSVDAWGSGKTAFGDEDAAGGGEQYIELIGTQLWVAGMVDLGRFRRVSDFLNIVQGYLVIHDVVVMTRVGEATQLTLPELRVLPDDISVVGQLAREAGSTSDAGAIIERTVQRLVVLTRAHVIDGDVSIPGDGSIMSFVDATDPKFIPMTDVRVRWLSDRKLAARYPFALVQRSQILGVATEGMKLGDADSTLRLAARLRAEIKPGEGERDGFDGEIGTVEDGSDTSDVPDPLT